MMFLQFVLAVKQVLKIQPYMHMNDEIAFADIFIFASGVEIFGIFR